MARGTGPQQTSSGGSKEPSIPVREIQQGYKSLQFDIAEQNGV
jgi:hypothetical protein